MTSDYGYGYGCYHYGSGYDDDDVTQSDREYAIAAYSDTYKSAYGCRPRISWGGVPTTDIWDAEAAIHDGCDFTRLDDEWDATLDFLDTAYSLEESARIQEEIRANQKAADTAEDRLWAIQDHLELSGVRQRRRR